MNLSDESAEVSQAGFVHWKFKWTFTFSTERVDWRRIWFFYWKGKNQDEHCRIYTDSRTLFRDWRVYYKNELDYHGIRYVLKLKSSSNITEEEAMTAAQNILIQRIDEKHLWIIYDTQNIKEAIEIFVSQTPVLVTFRSWENFIYLIIMAWLMFMTLWDND